MEVILLWKKSKPFFGWSIIPNIITEKWGYREVIKKIIQRGILQSLRIQVEESHV